MPSRKRCKSTKFIFCQTWWGAFERFSWNQKFIWKQMQLLNSKKSLFAVAEICSGEHFQIIYLVCCMGPLCLPFLNQWIFQQANWLTNRISGKNYDYVIHLISSCSTMVSFNKIQLILNKLSLIRLKILICCHESSF